MKCLLCAKKIRVGQTYGEIAPGHKAHLECIKIERKRKAESAWLEDFKVTGKATS